MATSLSILNALHAPPFSSRGTKFPAAFLHHQNVRIIQSFFLMEQLVLKDRSWWAPYLATLPKPVEVEALYFTDGESDIKALKGTRLETAIVKQIEGWKTQFIQGMDHLRELAWPNAVKEIYTW